MTDFSAIAAARLAEFPSALRSGAKLTRLASNIPALICLPETPGPAPTVLWFHGRTAYKELDPGRYLRWVRAGIAACAIDLPGHGERTELDRQQGPGTLGVLEQAIGEVDAIVESLRAPEYQGIIDTTRLAIGGMSAGGMVTLRRLCDPHQFTCAAVEATTGWLQGLYAPTSDSSSPNMWNVPYPQDQLARLDAMSHLSNFKPLPLLALHSRADRIVRFPIQERFINELRAHYKQSGQPESLIDFHVWDQTGAPDEHVGFGKVSHEAKNAQTAFLAKWLNPTPPQQ